MVSSNEQITLSLRFRWRRCDIFVHSPAYSSMLQRAGCHSAAVDFETSYLQDVLHLQDGDTEERLDSELRAEAKECGVEVNISPAGEHRSHREAVSSDLSRRSQESVASRASQLTGLVSIRSDVSRGHHHQPSSRAQPRTSLSFRDYDNLLARAVPSSRQSISMSPPTTPTQSTSSLPPSPPESSPKRHLRRIRGLSMLHLRRTTSSSSLDESCPHCPQGSLHQRRAVHKLPCGHRLCTQALRSTIKAGIDSKAGVVPRCCGLPIPGGLVELVMTQGEQKALLEKSEQWNESASIAPSSASETKEFGNTRRPGALSMRSRTVSVESKVDSINPRVQNDLDGLTESSEYRQLRSAQTETRDRLLAWTDAQQAALQTQHHTLKGELKAKHEVCMEELVEHHIVATSEAEDKQVKAEADMREIHSQEKRDNATALKHMEAYCAGRYSTGEPHKRTVTEQDCAERDKTRRNRDQMDARHGSAINVLRGEQGRRMKLRFQRQEKEVQDLDRAQRKAELELERACGQAAHDLDDTVADKRQRLRSRWELETAILAKKIEKEPGAVV